MSDGKSINTEYELPHPPEKVWRALTEPGLLERWLMPSDMRAVVGHKFTFKAPPMPGWDGTVHCEVLEVEPQRKLRYSWKGGPEQYRLDSTVTWTLVPTATGTRLELVHAGFQPHNAMAYDAMGKGWRSKMAERIRAVLDSI